MNGYECGMCGCAPCVCAEIERRKRIEDGKEAIQAFYQASTHLNKWKRRIVLWLWPDLVHVMDEIKDYYQKNLWKWKD